jgi:hypothetical protein
MVIKWLDRTTVMINDSTFKIVWCEPMSDWTTKSFMPIIMITWCSHKHNMNNFTIAPFTVTEEATKSMVDCHVAANRKINQYLVDLWN